MESSDALVLSFLIIASSLVAGVQSSANFTLVNNCEFTVWPGIFSGSGSPAAPAAEYALQANETRTVAMPSSWRGRIWGRTDCWEDSSGRFSCLIGDCGTGKQECNGTSNIPTVTIAEFALDQFSGTDFYDISLVYGYNLPVLLEPRGGSGGDCKSVGCLADVNSVCPSELRVTGTGRDVLACKSACEAFLEDQYCCRGSNASNCQPTQFSQVFKRACPNAYSFTLDDVNVTFSCTRADYAISFCPPGSARLNRPTPASPGSSPPPASGNVPQSSSNGRRNWTAIIAGVVSAVVLLIFVVGLIVWRKIKKEKRDKDLQELLTLEGHTETRGHKRNGAKNHDLRLFSYETILSATRNFSLENKLGEGGFGSVYKGKTSEGQDLAVKLLSRQSGQGLLEFKTELILISKLQHVNLVKLHGLCIHGDDKMIIYDYMPNKSLDFFLFNPSKKEQLNWPRRFNIIEGIAQGLLYLHKYSRLKIIHRDLKPSNILLDENMNAKISDFGLARVFEHNIDEANTNRRVGTYGYMAPEYAMQGIFSVKSDVYSFGVLTLEIVSGRKNNCFHQIEGPLNLVEYAWELWRNDSALQLMDPTLQDSCIAQQLQRCIHVALLCVENRAVDRLFIEDVILMLKSETMILPMPKNPSFIARNFVQVEVKKSTRDTCTQNHVTLSEIEGR